MLKSTAGGGGIGMQLCRNESELSGAYASVERLARSNFSDGGLFLEKYIEQARHIEVQLFGDGSGTVIALGERDCSMQRRNQKVIEETPAPGLTAATRERLYDAAVRLGPAVGYRSAGTVEFVYDVATEQFYFLEVNTRLQVEHGVTEEVIGRRPGRVDDPGCGRGAARSRRVSLRAARPCHPGAALRRGSESQFPALERAAVARGAAGRTCAWIVGSRPAREVSSFYDPLLAKIIVHGPTRELALEKLRTALDASSVYGIETNLEYLRRNPGHRRLSGRAAVHAVSGRAWSSGRCRWRFCARVRRRPCRILPGRLGFWNVGVPPSGPMDDLAFRLANRIVGNPTSAAGLELTGKGPTLQFGVDSVIALTGATHDAPTLEGQRVPFWEPIVVKAGSVLTLGSIDGPGQRAYLAVKGGFDVPEYLGSRSTFTLGQFGGHVGRALAQRRCVETYAVDARLSTDALVWRAPRSRHTASTGISR